MRSFILCKLSWLATQSPLQASPPSAGFWKGFTSLSGWATCGCVKEAVERGLRKLPQESQTRRLGQYLFVDSPLKGMMTKKTLLKNCGEQVGGYFHSNTARVGAQPGLCAQCRTLFANAPALSGPVISNFDDVQSEIRHWRQEGESLDSVKAVFKALHELGPLPKWINPQHLTPFFAKHLTNLSQNDIAMMYFWACKLKVDDKKFLEAAAKAILEERPQDMNNKSIVLVIYATALLNPGSSIGSSQPGSKSRQFPSSDLLINKLAEELVEPNRIVSLTRQELTNSLYGLGWLGFGDMKIAGELLEKFCGMGPLEELSEQEVVNTLHGISLLGLKDHSLTASIASEALMESRISRYSVKEIATLLHTLSALGCSHKCDDERLKAILVEATKSDRLSGCEDQHLSNMISSLAQLKHEGFESDTEFMRILVEEAVRSERRDAISSQNLAGILYTLAMNGFNEENTVGRLLDEIGREDRVKKYSTKDVCAIICGLGQMDVKEGPLLERLIRRLSQPLLLKEMSDKQILNVMMSLANLDFRHPEVVAPLFNRALQSGEGAIDPTILSQFALCSGKLGSGLTPAIESLLKKAVSQSMEPLSNESLIMLLHGLGDLGPSAADLVEPVIEEVVRNERLESLSPRDVALAVYTLGQIRKGEPQIMDKLLWEFTKQGVLENASNSILSNVMYGLGQLRHVPSEGVVVLLEDEIAKESRLGSYVLQELACIIHSLGLLRLEKRGKVAIATDKLALLAVSDEKMLEGGTNVELACLLYGLCHLRYKNPKVLEALMGTLVDGHRLAKFSNKDVCNVLYAIGQMGYSHIDHVRPLVEEAKEVGRMSRYSPVQVATLIYSLGKLRYDSHLSVQAFVDEILRPQRLGSLKPQDLANVLHGLVYTKVGTGNAVNQILEEIGRVEIRTDFIGSEILTITRCLCNLRINAPSRKVEALLETFVYEMCRSERLKEYDARQLSQVCTLLSDGKNRDPALALELLKEMTKGPASKEMSLVELAKVVWSIGPTAQVKKDERPLMVVLTRALIHMVLNRVGGFEDMPPVQLAEMIIGMGCMGLRDYKIIDSMVEEIVKPDCLEVYRPWHLCKIFRALGQLQSQNRYGLRILSSEISKPGNVEKMQPDQWSELMSGVVMLGNFRHEELFQVVASQVRIGNKDPLVKMEGIRSAARR